MWQHPPHEAMNNARVPVVSRSSFFTKGSARQIKMSYVAGRVNIRIIVSVLERAVLAFSYFLLFCYANTGEPFLVLFALLFLTTNIDKQPEMKDFESLFNLVSRYIEQLNPR